MRFTLNALASFPDQLAVHFAAIPPDRRAWAPPSWQGVPSEQLTAIEQLCHVRDIEIDGYHVRFQRTLSEHRPSLPGIDTYAYARDRDYASADPDQVLAEFRTARATTLRLLQDLDEASLSRSADFEGYGQVTLRSLIHYLCSHDQQHLAGLQWLLGRMHAETGSRPWSVP